MAESQIIRDSKLEVCVQVQPDVSEDTDDRCKSSDTAIEFDKISAVDKKG